MKEYLARLSGIFLYAIAVVLPVAGFFLAIARFVEKDNEEGARMLACTVLGAVIYATVFR
jgi:hypothetical protein